MSIAPKEVLLYGHGKLLLTGEYFILDGATGLAIPTRQGQHLRVKTLSSKSHTLYWIALNHKRQVWLNLTFDSTTLTCTDTDSREGKTLSQILQYVRSLSPTFLSQPDDIAVETRLEFPNEWGLGSSSTLLYCIATWAGIDGVKLLRATMGGSGYDVASAGSDSPITYTIVEEKPSWQSVPFSPSFADSIYFVYTGQKQLSSTAIKAYKDLITDRPSIIQKINRITEECIRCTDLNAFAALMEEHETLLGTALQMPKVKDRLFPDYWGAVKSLGAWGGDFVMVTNHLGDAALADYMRAKGLDVIIPYHDMLFQA